MRSSMFHLRPHPFKVAEAQRIQQSGSGNSRRTAMSIKVGWCFITSPTCFVLKAVCSEPVLYYFSAMLGKNAIGLPCPAIHANFSLRSKEVGNRFVPFRTQEAMVFFFIPVVPSSSVFAKQVRTISHPNIKCLES